MEIIYAGNWDGNLESRESEWKLRDTLSKPRERQKETAVTILFSGFSWGDFYYLFILLVCSVWSFFRK